MGDNQDDKRMLANSLADDSMQCVRCLHGSASAYLARQYVDCAAILILALGGAASLYEFTHLMFIYPNAALILLPYFGDKTWRVITQKLAERRKLSSSDADNASGS